MFDCRRPLLLTGLLLLAVAWPLLGETPPVTDVAPAVAAAGEAGGSLFADETGKVYDIVIFLGRFHPMALHLPVGMLLLAFFGEVFIIVRRREDLDSAMLFALFFGANTAIVACVLGFLLSQGGGYDENLVDRHQWLGLATAAFACAAYFLRWKMSKGAIELTKLYRVTLVVTIIVMSIGGHDGGSLTHGTSYLTDYWPFAADEDNGGAKGSELYAKVEPLFDQYCYSCHGKDKQKGDYRMDQKWIAFAGGESGEPAIVPYRPMDSNLVRVLLLPKHEDEVMPPEGKAAPTAEEIMLIIEWISEGADWPGDTTSAAATEVETPKEPTTDPEPPATAEKPTEPSPAAEYVFPTADQTVEFYAHVRPLMEVRCIKCHGAEKQKGDLRVDTVAWILAGSENGPVVVPGKSEKSTFYTLTTLDEEDDDVMPSKGDLLTVDEQNVLKRWIDDGLYVNEAKNPGPAVDRGPETK
jgi:uncharacterized membrane protein